MSQAQLGQLVVGHAQQSFACPARKVVAGLRQKHQPVSASSHMCGPCTDHAAILPLLMLDSNGFTGELQALHLRAFEQSEAVCIRLVVEWRRDSVKQHACKSKGEVFFFSSARVTNIVYESRLKWDDDPRTPRPPIMSRVGYACLCELHESMRITDLKLVAAVVDEETLLQQQSLAAAALRPLAADPDVADALHATA